MWKLICEFENYTFKMMATSTRGQWVMSIGMALALIFLIFVEYIR